MDVSLSKKLSSLCLISQRKLESILSTCGDKKDLIIEPNIIQAFERIGGASWLRQNGVEKIYKLEPKVGSTTNTNRVYFIPSSLITYKYVLDQINSLLSQNIIDKNTIITIIIIPKVLAIYETLIEEEGLSEIATLKSFQWELINIDENVLSLELPFLYKAVFVDKNTSLLNSISNSLWTLSQVVGKPNIFVSVGKQSSSILEMYNIYCETFSRDSKINEESEFGALLIVDRDQDYASGLLTPSTYTGLLYEIFNVKSGKVDLDSENVKYKQEKLDLELKLENQEKKQRKPTSMILDGYTDPIYSEIKYRHFSTVFSTLSAKAKDLNTEGHSIGDLGINQMKEYVSSKLQQVIATKRCLSNHVLACETIVAALGDKFEDLQTVERSMLNNRNKKSNFSYVDEHFCTDIGMYSSLRLMCLLTLTQGITYDEYTGLVTKYLHAFGYKYLYVFQNLASAGLMILPTVGKPQLGLPNLASISERLPRWQNNFQTAVNKLKQLPNESVDTSVKDPTCPSYVFNRSYIPFIAAISSILLKADNLNEVVTKLSLINDVKIGGAVFDNISKIDELGEKLSRTNLEKDSASFNDIDIGCKDLETAACFLRGLSFSLFPLRPKSLLIYVVGGITQAEIAACHLVEKLTGGTVVISSDSIISSENLIQSAIQ